MNMNQPGSMLILTIASGMRTVWFDTNNVVLKSTSQAPPYIRWWMASVCWTMLFEAMAKNNWRVDLVANAGPTVTECDTRIDLYKWGHAWSRVTVVSTRTDMFYVFGNTESDKKIWLIKSKLRPLDPSHKLGNTLILLNELKQIFQSLQ